MQFFQLAVAAIASASAVHAMPASGADTKAAGKRSDPSGSGVCNGYTCDYELQDLTCKFGTSAKENGGGNGKKCDVYNFGEGEAYALCPGRS